MSEPHYEQRKIPAAALCFKVTEFQLSDHVEGSKTAPIRLVARAGRPIEHPYFGSVVHDFATMQHKSKIPIDYAHDDKEVIGFVNKFDATDGDLVLSGTIVPFRSGDRAAEIMAKAKAGVPYEASIDFRAPMQMEMLGQGQQQLVNGNMVDGPATIITNWTLRGVAVCPYGADSGTSSQFAAGDEITVTVLEKEQQMAEPETTAVAAEPIPAVEQISKQKRMKAADYLKAFGRDGAVWFAEGKTFAEAAALHAAAQTEWRGAIDAQLTQLKAELAALMQRFAALTSAGGAGEGSPIQFGSAGEVKQKRPGKGIRFSAGV